jgi:hypothetical protein
MLYTSVLYSTVIIPVAGEVERDWAILCLSYSREPTRNHLVDTALAYQTLHDTLQNGVFRHEYPGMLIL